MYFPLCACSICLLALSGLGRTAVSLFNLTTACAGSISNLLGTDAWWAAGAEACLGTRRGGGLSSEGTTVVSGTSDSLTWARTVPSFTCSRAAVRIAVASARIVPRLASIASPLHRHNRSTRATHRASVHVARLGLVLIVSLAPFRKQKPFVNVMIDEVPGQELVVRVWARHVEIGIRHRTPTTLGIAANLLELAPDLARRLAIPLCKALENRAHATVTPRNQGLKVRLARGFRIQVGAKAPQLRPQQRDLPAGAARVVHRIPLERGPRFGDEGIQRHGHMPEALTRHARPFENLRGELRHPEHVVVTFLRKPYHEIELQVFHPLTHHHRRGA